MNTLLLSRAVQDYLRSREKEDAARLALEASPFEGIEPGELARQLNGMQRSKEKLPTWYNNPNIYYPPNINLEQTSSETTARYKASLVSGKNGIDLSGGFGVDTYFLAEKHQHFTYCERDKDLFPIAQHNLAQLGSATVKTVLSDGIAYLEETKDTYDTIYVDPSRRSDVKGKVFRLEDCSPDLSVYMKLLLEKGRKILVKTSPLLDIQLGIRQLENVHSIHILAVNNDVKELLWDCRQQPAPSVQVYTRNWGKNGVQEFDFELAAEGRCAGDYGKPQDYLFEPNAAILKAGAFCLTGAKFSLKKLGKHSHLYTAAEAVNFPGRIFKINSFHPFSRKNLNRTKPAKANLSTRNFPMAVADLRKRFKIRDGGDDYLFFTTLEGGEKVVIHCKKA